MRLEDISGRIESISPLELQESWDNSGFQVKLGNPEIHKVLVAMEVTGDVIGEAIEKEAQLIVCHHPMIFGSLKKIDLDEVVGNYISLLMQNGISVYATHTPFDKCKGGNNDYLARLLGLINIGMMPGDSSEICRIGELREPERLVDFAEKIKAIAGLEEEGLRFTGYADSMIQKVGICTGSGAEFLEAAFYNGCDLFITGDVKYHAAQLAKELGMNLLDMGHFGTEQFFTENMAALLIEKCGNECEIFESSVDLNPFEML